MKTYKPSLSAHFTFIVVMIGLLLFQPTDTSKALTINGIVILSIGALLFALRKKSFERIEIDEEKATIHVKIHFTFFCKIKSLTYPINDIDIVYVNEIFGRGTNTKMFVLSFKGKTELKINPLLMAWSYEDLDDIISQVYQLKNKENGENFRPHTTNI